MKIGTEIKIKAISKHVKDRINQFGDKWIIEKICDKVGFDIRIGMWIGLIDVKTKKDFRWIRSVDDKNFEVV